MAVQDTHPEYDQSVKLWETLRDCIAGQEVVHAAATKYLPKLEGQTSAEYNAYLGRALFYATTSRTLDGLTGMIFRKPPVYDLPVVLEDFENNITLDGLSIENFAESLTAEVVSVGRAGVLVDHPNALEDGLITRARAEQSNLRPFLKLYTAESIISWRYAAVNNNQVLAEVRLKEIERIQEGEFEHTDIEQIRVLDLNPSGQYRQRIYRKKSTANSSMENWEQFGDDIIPLMRGSALDKIPFYFTGVKSNSATVDKPPLIDLANANISHYKTIADLEHGAHFTALPTAVITGLSPSDDEDAEYRIGSATAWTFSNPETRAAYLEFQGSGLNTLEVRAEKKEQQMAFLGARMLMPEKKGIEATQTVQLQRMGETSILASIAQSVSETMENALTMAAEWGGSTEEAEYKLNMDFMPTEMDPQALMALIQSWQSGAIAYSDLFMNLKKGEIIADNRTEEDVLEDISQENPFTDEDLNG